MSNRFTSSRVLPRTSYWGLKWFVRPEANYLILRHFHIGSEILQFVAANLPGVQIPLLPRTLEDLIDNVFLQHDLNFFNSIIRLRVSRSSPGLSSIPMASPPGASTSTGRASRAAA